MTRKPADPAAPIDPEGLARLMAASVDPSQAALDAIEIIDGRRVRLHITNQSFDLAFEGEEPDEAPWMKRMLAHALDTFASRAKAAAYERAARAVEGMRDGFSVAIGAEDGGREVAVKGPDGPWVLNPDAAAAIRALAAEGRGA